MSAETRSHHDAAPVARAHTSAVDGMSVPDVRMSLAALRAIWSRHSPVDPMYTCAPLPCGMSAGDFAFHFVLGHHRKRHRRTS